MPNVLYIRTLYSTYAIHRFSLLFHHPLKQLLLKSPSGKGVEYHVVYRIYSALLNKENRRPKQQRSARELTNQATAQNKRIKEEE